MTENPKSEIKSTLERTTILIDSEKKKRLKELAGKLPIPNNKLSDLIRKIIDEYLDDIDNPKDKKS